MMQSPVDRGWAWVVLAASLGVHYLSGVLVYFVGVIHVELLDKYQSDVTTTSWAGAIYSSLQMLAAPLATLLVHHYGCRVSVMAGGVMLCLGFTMSAFANSVSLLVFTYGLVAGTGLGLTYSPTIMTVGFYFDRLRGLASGISVSACGVGILSGSLITQLLIDIYGLSGAFLLIGGISLNNVAFAVFFRPTPHEGRRLKQNRMLKASTKASCEDIPLTENSNDAKTSDRKLSEGDCHGTTILCGDKCSNASENEPNLLSPIPPSAQLSGGRYGASRTNLESDSDSKGAEHGTALQDQESCKLLAENCHHSNNSTQQALGSQSDGSGQCAVSGTTQLSKHENGSDSDREDQHSPAGNNGNSRAGQNIMGFVASELEKKWKSVRPLLLNRGFVCHCFSVFFAHVNLSGVYMHLPEYAITLGNSVTMAATLFVGVGAFSLVSRLVCGCLTTGPKVNALYVSIAMLTVCGASTALFPLYSASYAGQMAFASLFGLSSGGIYTLINVLTVQLVGFGDTLIMAYGLEVFLMGVGYVVGPPLAGIIVDSGGTYEHSFIFLGLTMFASAACDLLAKLVHKTPAEDLTFVRTVGENSEIEPEVGDALSFKART